MKRRESERDPGKSGQPCETDHMGRICLEKGRGDRNKSDKSIVNCCCGMMMI